jgi:hypothetical protein
MGELFTRVLGQVGEKCHISFESEFNWPKPMSFLNPDPVNNRSLPPTAPMDTASRFKRPKRGASIKPRASAPPNK